MADSITQQIVDRIIVDLNTIKIVNGAQKDIVTVVDRKKVPWKETELPAINVNDISGEVTKNGSNHMNDLNIVLELKTNGDDHVKDGRNFAADMVRVLGADICLNQLVQKMSTIIVESSDDEQESKKFTSVTMTFTVTFITPIFNGFNLA